MGITAFVGTVVEANNANVNPTSPITPQDGDLLLCCVAWRVAVTESVSLSGWTQRVHANASARLLDVWYLVIPPGGAAGYSNPTVTVSGGGITGNVIAANIIALRGSPGVVWSWLTNGAVYTGTSGEDIGPISAPTATRGSGAVLFLGQRNSGDATNVAVLSGDSIGWTRTQNHFTTLGSDISFVGSIGIWSGSVPTLTAKTFNFTDGTPATRLGVAVAVEEITNLSADAGAKTITGKAAGMNFARIMAAGTGTYTKTGQPAIVGRQRTLVCAAGTKTITGQAAQKGRGFQASTGAKTLAGNAAVLTKSTPTAKVLVAAAKAFTISGQAMGPHKGYYLAMSYGLHPIAPVDMRFIVRVPETLEAGKLTLFGPPTTGLLKSHILHCEAGDLSVGASAAQTRVSSMWQPVSMPGTATWTKLL